MKKDLYNLVFETESNPKSGLEVSEMASNPKSGRDVRIIGSNYKNYDIVFEIRDKNEGRKSHK